MPQSVAYRRQLNLETGEARVCYDGDGGIVESVFSSRAHGVNVIRLQAEGGRKINASLSLAETPGRKGSHFEHNLDSSFRSVTSTAEPGWLLYHADYRQDPGGYEGVARVETVGGMQLTEGDCLRIENADEVVVVMQITPLERGEKRKTAAAKRGLSHMPHSYASLLEAHATLHSRLFNRMTLDLGCARLWRL